MNKVYDGTTTRDRDARPTTGVAGDVLHRQLHHRHLRRQERRHRQDRDASAASSITGADAGNYTLSTPTTTTTADITPRALTVTATGVNKVYDGTTTRDGRPRRRPASPATTLTDSYTTAASPTRTSGTGKTVTVSGITISRRRRRQLHLVNTTASTTAEHHAARADGDGATGVNKVYDGTTAATVTLSDDRVSGDVL